MANRKPGSLPDNPLQQSMTDRVPAAEWGG
jgi:hypothetical protein